MKRKSLRAALSCALVALMSFGLAFSAQAEGMDDVISYEIQGAGTGSQGTYLVKVTVVSKKKKNMELPLKLSAVHGALFRGFSNTETRQSQKAIASPALEAQYAEFFSDFFSEDGTAANYASLVPGSISVTKVAKRYHVSATLTVQKDALRSYLEAQGILKGLSTGF